MKRILCILLLLACIANAETWIYGRSRLSTGYRQEKNNGKIPSSLYPPALWYEFNYNDSTVVYDLSGNNNTGTVSGATWVQETEGGYYSFDGTTNTYLYNNTFVNRLATATNGAVIWWQYKSVGGLNLYPLSICRKANTTFCGLYPYCAEATSDSNLNVQLIVDGTVFWRGATPSGSASNWRGKWAQIAIVHDGTIPHFYINGREVAFTYTKAKDKSKWFKAFAGDATSKPDTLQISGEWVGSILYSAWNGYIDAPLIITGNVTSNQVYSLYLRGR